MSENIPEYLREELAIVFKVYCATGEGGGIDPTCSPHGGESDDGEGDGEDEKTVLLRALGGKALTEGAVHTIDRDDQYAIENEISNWRKSTAQDIGQSAVDYHEGIVVGYRDSNGTLQGIMNYVVEDDYVEVKYLASNKTGVGLRLMGTAMKRATEENLDLQLSSVRAARKFYEAVGMEYLEEDGGLTRYSIGQKGMQKVLDVLGKARRDPDQLELTLGGKAPSQRLSHAGSHSMEERARAYRQWEGRPPRARREEYFQQQAT